MGTSNHNYNRCLHCLHYDELDSTCKAHPPAYAGDIEDEDGEVYAHFVQPIIEHAWVTGCSEWRAAAPEKTENERLLELVMAAKAHKKSRGDEEAASDE